MSFPNRNSFKQDKHSDSIKGTLVKVGKDFIELKKDSKRTIIRFSNIKKVTFSKDCRVDDCHCHHNKCCDRRDDHDFRCREHHKCDDRNDGFNFFDHFWKKPNHFKDCDRMRFKRDDWGFHKGFDCHDHCCRRNDCHDCCKHDHDKKHHDCFMHDDGHFEKDPDWWMNDDWDFKKRHDGWIHFKKHHNWLKHNGWDFNKHHDDDRHDDCDCHKHHDGDRHNDWDFKKHYGCDLHDDCDCHRHHDGDQHDDWDFKKHHGCDLHDDCDCHRHDDCWRHDDCKKCCDCCKKDLTTRERLHCLIGCKVKVFLCCN